MIQNKIEAVKTAVSHGVSPAMATPLMPDRYTVNIEVVPALVSFLMEKGVKGLFVSGTTGEGILTALSERKRLFEAAVSALKEHGGVSILHVGTNNLRDTLALAESAAENGADAIAVLPGFFYGLSDDAIVTFFKEIGAAFPGMPLIGYDIPHLAVNGFTPSLVHALCATVPSFAGLKSSRGDALMVRALIESLPADKFILAGNERMASGSLTLRADGLITGLSTAVPEPFVALCNAAAASDLNGMREAQNKINQILDLTPPGARIGFIKQILNERGIPVGHPIPPRPAVAQVGWGKIEEILAG